MVDAGPAIHVQLKGIYHDNDHKTGFVELSTRQHKSSKSAVTKSWLLPIVIPCFGVAEPIVGAVVVGVQS